VTVAAGPAQECAGLANKIFFLPITNFPPV